MTWEFLATLPGRPGRGKLFSGPRGGSPACTGQEGGPRNFADERGSSRMRALTWQGNLDVRVTDVARPRGSRNRTTPSSRSPSDRDICGSDLHPVRGPGAVPVPPGDVLGHEAMGRGDPRSARTVTNLVPWRPGGSSRSTSPCGHCWMCTRGLYAQLRDHAGPGSKARGRPLFGYTSLYGSVPGGQAQFLRVPQAQFGPVKIPADGPDEQYLFLSDVLPTGLPGLSLRRYAPRTGTAGPCFGPGAPSGSSSRRGSPGTSAWSGSSAWEPGARAPGRRGPGSGSEARRPERDRRPPPGHAPRDDRGPGARTAVIDAVGHGRRTGTMRRAGRSKLAEVVAQRGRRACCRTGVAQKITDCGRGRPAGRAARRGQGPCAAAATVSVSGRLRRGGRPPCR